MAICFPPGASALGRGGAGRGEQVMVGQVGRRAFWHIKCTVGKSAIVRGGWCGKLLSC